MEFVVCRESLIHLVLGTVAMLWMNMAATAAGAAEYRPRNLVENGGFESYLYNSSNAIHPDLEYVYAPSYEIPGWFVEKGSIKWFVEKGSIKWGGKGRWVFPGSSLCAINLNGVSPGTIKTSVITIANFSVYTVLVDAAAHPNHELPKNFPRSFSLSVDAARASSIYPNGDNNINGSRSIVTLNSTEIRVVAAGNDPNFIDWQTWALAFNTSPVGGGPVTLRLSSRTPGIHGPLIDNVRVYPGLFFPPPALHLRQSSRTGSLRYTLIGTIIGSLFTVLAVFLGLYIRRKRHMEKRGDIQRFSRERIRIFPYRVLKVATKNFHPTCKLGQGGFGAVFKGVLGDGTVVAVKQLSSTSFQGQTEFLNEISLISRVQHRNLVSLKGCSVKGNQRLLVYEFLENRSLHQALIDKRYAIRMDWATRMKIAVGTARGLVYMHEDAQERIIHRDIKASNILLDKSFNPKIADFGLAKIFETGDRTHITTRVAGTLGYLAPEYALRGQLTEKADVFSFGILALEIVSGRTNTDTSLPIKQQYLVDWALQLLEENRILNLVDPALGKDYEIKGAGLLIHVGLLCTQDQSSRRPSMSHALSMLLGEAPLLNVLKGSRDHNTPLEVIMTQMLSKNEYRDFNDLAVNINI